MSSDDVQRPVEETNYDEGSDSSESNHKRNHPLFELESKFRPISNEITYRYLCSICVSILFHLLDVGTDIYLAYQYYSFQQTTYFFLTISFVFIPSLIITLISIRMYAGDEEPVSKKKWIFRSFMLIFQFAPIVRYIEVLQDAIELKKNKLENNDENFNKFYKPLLMKDSNLSLLRLIECFLESAPQQVLQWTILLRMELNNLNFYQYMTIFTSFLSTAWCFAIYNRSVRFARNEKNNLKWISSCCQMIWLFSIITSRILSISEAASVFPKCTLIGCMIHWFIMTVWLSIFERTWFCYRSSSEMKSKVKQILEIFFSAVLGLVFIFAFLTVKDGDTMHKYIFYYTLCFIENALAVVFWSIYGYENLKNIWWYIPLLVTTCVLFFIGIFSMMIYYRYYHPKIGKINNLSLTLSAVISPYEMTTLSPIPMNRIEKWVQADG